MYRKNVKRIVKTFYDALEEGKILGRRCTRCGHVEYPPYLACNLCGNLDTEWVEMPKTAMCTQILPPPPCFFEPDVKKRLGDYWHGSILPENCDESCSLLLNIIPEKLEEARAKLPLEVRPVIVQDEDVKVVYWEFTDPQFRRDAEYTPDGEGTGETLSAPAAEKEEAPAASADFKEDPVAMTVIECAAEAYGADASGLTPATDLREELSNQSMKMLAFLSGLEDELDVTIEMSEARALKTIGDFVQKVKEKAE